jgi:hypothetical protein
VFRDFSSGVLGCNHTILLLSRSKIEGVIGCTHTCGILQLVDGAIVVGVSSCRVGAAARVALLASLSFSSAAAWARPILLAPSSAPSSATCRASHLGGLPHGPGRQDSSRRHLVLDTLRGGKSGRSVTMANTLEGARRADTWLKDKGVEFTVVQQQQATGKCRDSAGIILPCMKGNTYMHASMHKYIHAYIFT